jgi:DNA invertase Pin-like site-specific DNA recombinase
MKIAIYARCSTKDKGQNPEVQLDALRKYCASMPWEVYKEYVDMASAGDLLNRTAWTQLMKDASLHRFDTLLIWKLDRAFRSIVHASTTLQMLNSYRVGFRSLMDAAIDTTTPNGLLTFNILASVAQFEKDLITLRINEGITYAKVYGTKSGKAIGRTPYDIPLENVCKAVQDSCGNYSKAARTLSVKFGKTVTPGFVLSRLKRASITKEGLQMVGQNLIESQTQNVDVDDGLAKQVVC